MRRRLLIVLLAMGTIGGYASGFASMSRHHRYRCHGGSWGERWDSRWDSRGPRESWESSRAPRWSAPPGAAPAPAPTAEAPPPSPEPR